MADYEDVYAPDLTEETESTLSGSEQFVMFDAVEGKRAELSTIADYIVENGEIDGSDIPTIVSTIEGNIGTVDTKVGDLTDLETTDKTDIVSAINEVNGKAEDADEHVGDLPELETEDKTSAVDAINEVLGKIPVMTKEVTGNPIVVDDALNADVVSLGVELEPIQDLHGYDKPWAAGAGKNKIDESTLVQGNWNYEGPNTPNNVVTHGYLPIKGGITYMWSQTEQVAGRYIRFYDANQEYDASGDVSQYNATNATFNAPQWAVYMRVLWYNVSSEITPDDIKALKPQIEEGSTATSWTPYSNICPITGHDSVTVTKHSKNLLPYPYSASGTTTRDGITWTVNSDGSVDCSGTATSATYLWLFGGGTAPIPAWIEAGGTYAVSCGNGTPVTGYPRLQMILYGSTNIAVTEGSRTLPDDLSSYTGFAVVLQVINGTTIPSGTRVYPQVEAGNTPTAYEPYRTPVSTTVALPSTVYGGKIGVTDGEGQVTKGYIKLNTADMDNSEDYPGWKASGVRDIIGAGFNGTISNGFTNVSPTNTNAINANTVSTNDIIFLSKAYFGLTQTDWKNLAMDIEFIIPYATPTDISTTPTTVTLFNGGNKVVSDGNMDMVYVRDIVKVIEKLEG